MQEIKLNSEAAASLEDTGKSEKAELLKNKGHFLLKTQKKPKVSP
jgi:hypothetical protein